MNPIANAPPLIRVSIEYMRRELAYALSAYQKEFSEWAQKELERVLTPEYIAGQVRTHAMVILDRAIRDAVEDAIRNYVGSEVRDVIHAAAVDAGKAAIERLKKGSAG